MKVWEIFSSQFTSIGGKNTIQLVLRPITTIKHIAFSSLDIFITLTTVCLLVITKMNSLLKVSVTLLITVIDIISYSQTSNQNKLAANIII